ncbi:MAG: DUF4188 domain-containing protein [Ktedonobacterales bacterium]
MTKVFKGRYTAQAEGPFVVFIIGMRVNRLWALHKWIPTAMAMGPMLHTLYTHQQEKGFMGAHTFLSWRGVMLVQYWRSFEDLERFARSKDDPHLKAWQRFYKAVGSDGSVGIFHETYMIQPGQYEAIYGNMPIFGLAAATQHVTIAERRQSARGRIGGEDAPAMSPPITPPIAPATAPEVAEIMR